MPPYRSSGHYDSWWLIRAGAGLAMIAVVSEPRVLTMRAYGYGRVDSGGSFADRASRRADHRVLQELYAKRSAETVGDVEIEQTDLPSGPALRVRGKCIEQADEQGQGLLMEAVTCAILPPGLADAVVATMSWTALQLGDKLAEMPDAIARTIRVTPSM